MGLTCNQTTEQRVVENNFEWKSNITAKNSNYVTDSPIESVQNFRGSLMSKNEDICDSHISRGQRRDRIFSFVFAICSGKNGLKAQIFQTICKK